jgi:hypothetical protein
MAKNCVRLTGTKEGAHKSSMFIIWVNDSTRAEAHKLSAKATFGQTRNQQKVGKRK